MKEGKIYWQEDDIDPDRPLKTGFSYSGDDITVSHFQDVTLGHSYNRRLYDNDESPISEDFHMFARIEPGMYHHFLHHHGVDALNPDHGDALMALLHDPMYRDVRVAPGEFRKEIKPEYFRGSTSSGKSPAELIGKKVH